MSHESDAQLSLTKRGGQMWGENYKGHTPIHSEIKVRIGQFSSSMGTFQWKKTG